MNQSQSLPLPEGLTGFRQKMGQYVPGQLSTGEKFWRDHYTYYHIFQVRVLLTNSFQLRFLKQRGYLLRPRYDPAWEPSWEQQGQQQDSYIDVNKYEDGISLTVC
jgi:hypothetical protein